MNGQQKMRRYEIINPLDSVSESCAPLTTCVSLVAFAMHLSENEFPLRSTALFPSAISMAILYADSQRHIV
jgi:hypothetical protein